MGDGEEDGGEVGIWGSGILTHPVKHNAGAV